MKNTTGAWIVRPRLNPQASLRLFCFPYAGGASIVFRSWADRLPANVETCLVELPGRGSRLNETLHTRLMPLVEATYQGILPALDGPFAFFGHSMGALISYELTRLLGKRDGRMPEHLFLSGHCAPHLPDSNKPLHDLPEAEFVKELRRLNGTPKAVLEHAELMDMLLPIMRADFAVCETYEYEQDEPLSCPITVFGGSQDFRVTREDLDAWRTQTNGSFSLQMFPGDHFFLQTAQPLLLQALTRELTKLTKAPIWRSM